MNAVYEHAVVLHLITKKSIPILLYGLESFSLYQYQLKLLDFVINRFFMKFFKTSDIFMWLLNVKSCLVLICPVCSLLVARTNSLKNLNIIMSHYLVKV